MLQAEAYSHRGRIANLCDGGIYIVSSVTAPERLPIEFDAAPTALSRMIDEVTTMPTKSAAPCWRRDFEGPAANVRFATSLIDIRLGPCLLDRMRAVGRQPRWREQSTAAEVFMRRGRSCMGMATSAACRLLLPCSTNP